MYIKTVIHFIQTHREHIRNGLLLAGLCIILFINSFGNQFVWDDQALVVENRYVISLHNPLKYFSADYWRDYRAVQGTRYLPLRTLSFAVDYAIWKLNPFGYHLTNLLLHIGNAFLVYILVLMVFNSTRAALFSSFLFAAHPMHVESITWVKNRTDLITLLFYAGGIIIFIKSLGHYVTMSPGENQKSKIKNQNLQGILLLIGSVVCYVLALMSKEMGVTLPAVLVLYILVVTDMKHWKKSLLLTVPFWAVCTGYLYFKFVVLEAGTMVEFVKPAVSLYSNMLIVVKTAACYAKLLILPFTFNADRMLSVPHSFFETAVLLSFCGIMLLAGIGWLLYRTSHKAFFAFSWIFITLAPVANIFFIVPRPIAEQRLYIPSVGFCILIGWILTRMRRAGTALLIFLMVPYSFAVIERNSDWKDSITLWKKTVEASPISARAHLNLANAYNRKGLYDEAFKEYTAAFRLAPNDADINTNLGVYYYTRNDKTRSLQCFYKAIANDPLDANAHGNLGYLFYLEGDNEKALAYLQKAIELDHTVSVFHYNLGEVYEKMNDIENAIKEYQSAVKYDPLSVDARNSLALLYVKKGIYGKAQDEFDAILDIDPEHMVVRRNKAELMRLIHDSVRDTFDPDITVITPAE